MKTFGFVIFLSWASFAQAAKILIMPSSENTREEVLDLGQALITQNLAVDVAPKSLRDFDGNGLSRSSYDVLLILDSGHDSFNIKTSAQMALLDFVRAGGTLIHQQGLSWLYARNRAAHTLLEDLVVFEATTTACQCGLNLVPQKGSVAGQEILSGISNPQNFAGCVESYNGNTRDPWGPPIELVLLNTENAVGYEKMLAIRRMGAGRVIGMNFTIRFDSASQLCLAKKNPMFVQLYKNILQLSKLPATPFR